MTIKQIIDLNNMTVELIDRQEYTAAVRTATRALRLQKTVQNEMKCEEQLSSEEAHSVLDDCMLLSKVNESKSSAAHTSFIYNQAIVLSPTLTDFTSISAILIFNSALAQQLAAETCHQLDSTKLLLKAKKMYELASRIPEVEENILFQFVLVNNTAVIEQKIGDKLTSKTYFEFLMTTFMIFVDQQCTEQLRQVRGFLRNVPLEQGDAAAAA